MIERLPNGRDFVDGDGDVRPMADWRDDDIAAHYDDLPADDREQFDSIINGTKLAEANLAQDRALGEGVLFFLENEHRSAEVSRSVHEHPSTQNVEPEQRHDVVAEIVAAYNEELARLRDIKKVPNVSAVQRDTLIAAIHRHLNEEQIARLKQQIGIIDADDQNDGTERPRDWFER